MASVVGEREVDLTKLSLEQLNQLKQSLEQEVKELTAHFASLKEAQLRLTTCRNTINDMSSATSGQEILVPLTQSLYVPGKIADVGRVMIDIGTGYYVEKSLPKAREYMEKRISAVSKNADSLQTIVHQKEQTLRTVAGYMNTKLMMMSEASGGSK